MYIFILIVFIAELIIAFNIIGLIVKADRRVRELNQFTESFNPLAEAGLQYIRCLVSNFHKSFSKIFNIVKKKQEQVMFKTIIMISIYVLLIIFKIKTDKALKIYDLIASIRDVAFELAV